MLMIFKIKSGGGTKLCLRGTHVQEFRMSRLSNWGMSITKSGTDTSPYLHSILYSSDMFPFARTRNGAARSQMDSECK